MSNPPAPAPRPVLQREWSTAQDDPPARGFVTADVIRGTAPDGKLEVLIGRAPDVEPELHLLAVGLIAEAALKMLVDHGATPEQVLKAVGDTLRRWG